ncbi:aromatic ring-hydroxylating oxygenase subunit alpha [Reyranella sp.]|uniref:aromatic ring-hydroxylating oxygenase subunit alpha n=1 Tax=Reyranella sp. TaxID=1929291 RepID=UPI003BABD02C
MTTAIEPASDLLAALDRGESLPAHWYTDPAILEQEMLQVFRRSWNYVGPLRELAEVGDYVTGHAGNVPVLVVRNDEGLAGFVNVCRHRRHLVMKGRGKAALLQCSYHAWTYDLAGGLRRAPRSAEEPGFRLEDFPLLPVRAEAVGPFVFVNLDPDAPAAETCYGPVLDIIARSGVDLATIELHSRGDWAARANWKAMLENYLECYHCAVAHPGFSAAIDVRPDVYTLASHGWFSSQAGRVRPAALEGRSKIELYDVRGAVAESQYHFLWPNLTININPGFPNLSVDVWLPDGTGATRGFSEQYFAPGVDPQFAEALVGFNRQVAQEDDDLTDSVQQGLAGGLPARGRFLTRSEQLVIQFQKMIARALSGASAV